MPPSIWVIKSADAELLRANQLVKLVFDKRENSVADMAAAGNKEAKQLQQQLQRDIQQVREVTRDSFGTTLGNHALTRLKTYNPLGFSPTSKSTLKRSFKWAVQPPGAGKANRILKWPGDNVGDTRSIAERWKGRLG